MSKSFIQKIENLILPLINELDIELYSVNYLKEGRNNFLRVYIYKMDREIDIDDCAMVSEAISKVLDESNLIKSAYFLEVASPGAERQLRNEKEITSAIGKGLLISLNEAINNDYIIDGKLVSFADDLLTIKNNGELVEIPHSQTKRIRLKIQL